MFGIELLEGRFSGRAKPINLATHGNKPGGILRINYLNSSSYISVANSNTLCRYV
jgi:hypothetical protein